MSEVDVSVIGPAMNESGNLEEFVERCFKAFSDCNMNAELIIVDDGSTDDTPFILRTLINRYSPKLIVLEHRKNLGLTQALQTGFHYARGEHIIWIPTDLEAHPDEDIPLLYDELAKGSDVVSGYRKGRADGKTFSSRIYNTVTNLLFGLKLKDMNWIKGFKRECLPTLHLRGDWHRFMIIMMHSAGFIIKEVETQWYSRKYGKSKYGFLRFPRSILDLLSIWFLIIFSKKPMRLFGTLGIFCLTVGVVAHLYLVGLYILEHTQVRPLFWFALASEMFGIQFILFGFISELIERTRENISKVQRMLLKDQKKTPINNEIVLQHQYYSN
jgi:glycosyltransferase involved in cell wall biosynthesis